MVASVSKVLLVSTLFLLPVLAACNLTSVPAQPEQGASQPVSPQAQRTQQLARPVVVPLVTTTPLPAPVVNLAPADTTLPTLLQDSEASVVASATPGFDMDVEDGPAPLAVQFGPRSRDEDLTYRWDFGDGVVSEEVNPQHSFGNSRQLQHHTDDQWSRRRCQLHPRPHCRITHHTGTNRRAGRQSQAGSCATHRSFRLQRFLRPDRQPRLGFRRWCARQRDSC